MAKKCIVWVRCSTERQEIESQKKETIEYAKSLKYNEFVIIGEVGASAYKVNKLYIEMVDRMKQLIESDKDIKAVVCWHLNRLARNDKIAMDIKEFLIEHKIQLHVKEPHVKLLKDDGTVDEGAELVFSVFSTMSKQQAAELRQKTKRAKARDKALHKYIGGPVVGFGYTIKDKMVVPDPDNSKIVNDIYNLYGSGQYSYATLVKEINERYGTNFGWYFMKNILDTTRYFDNTKYPPIITEEQYNKAKEQRNNSTSRPMTSKHFHFANRIIKCPNCGRGLTGNVRDYRCSLDCKTPRVSIPNMDGLLWVIVSHLESERLLHSDSKKELLQKKAVLASKINGVEQLSMKGEKKAQRAKKMALEGLIEVDEYKDILKQVEQENEERNKRIEGYKSEIRDIDRLIEEDTMSMRKILEVSDQINEYTEQQMRDIVRRWIVKITYTEDWIFSIETHTRTYKAKYDRYGYESRWYTINNKPLVVRPFIRDGNGSKFGKNRCKPNDIVTTLAWLSGSEIV